jgi:hypothetical protein
MTDVAQPLREASRWRLAWDAFRRRERAPVSPLDRSISFPELVWAHHERQKEVYANVLDGPWETEYRRRLKLFKDEHGKIIESYWCRYEASGVALTELTRPRRLSNFLRRDPILRLHTATDWRSANATLVAAWLHRWETAGIKASEILRDTSERIALHRIFAASSRLLGFLDRKPDAQAPPRAELATVVADQQEEYADVTDYYARAGENSARIVYFRGMVWGLALLAALVGGGFLVAWGADWIDPHDSSTYTLLVTVTMGAAGAVLSVMTRMARRDGFNLDFEVGRKSVRFLGGVRPWIGAMFAFALYLALKSNLVELLQASQKGIYFYATIAFLAGFSERRAKVLLDSAFSPGGSGVESAEPASGDDVRKANRPAGQMSRAT